MLTHFINIMNLKVTEMRYPINRFIYLKQYYLGVEQLKNLKGFYLTKLQLFIDIHVISHPIIFQIFVTSIESMCTGKIWNQSTF